MLSYKKLLFSSALSAFLFSTSVGYVFADTIMKPVVETSVLNMRSQPSITSQIVGKLEKGQSVDILEESGDWYKVKSSAGTTAWVNKAYLSVSTAVVKPSALNMRSQPDITSNIVKELQKGQFVDVLGESGDWYRVKSAAGTTAWVNKDYLSLKNPVNVSRGNSQRSEESDSSGTSQKLVTFSKKFLGVRYVWGGTSPKGFDCSGLIKYVYNSFGIELNRVAADQAKEGTYIKKADLAPGDLVFFDTDGEHNYINHVGIYIGGGEFIHASSGHGSVLTSDIVGGFYANTYMTARRILK